MPPTEIETIRIYVLVFPLFGRLALTSYPPLRLLMVFLVRIFIVAASRFIFHLLYVFVCGNEYLSFISRDLRIKILGGISLNPVYFDVVGEVGWG